MQWPVWTCKNENPVLLYRLRIINSIIYEIMHFSIFLNYGYTCYILSDSGSPVNAPRVTRGPFLRWPHTSWRVVTSTHQVMWQICGHMSQGHHSVPLRTIQRHLWSELFTAGDTCPGLASWLAGFIWMWRAEGPHTHTQCSTKLHWAIPEIQGHCQNVSFWCKTFVLYGS